MKSRSQMQRSSLSVSQLVAPPSLKRSGEVNTTGVTVSGELVINRPVSKMYSHTKSAADKRFEAENNRNDIELLLFVEKK